MLECRACEVRWSHGGLCWSCGGPGQGITLMDTVSPGSARWRPGND